MPRPKSFDETAVLQCAMMTFWRLGYDATTYRLLESEVGVGVRSLHNTFGEKDELFLRSLRMYRNMVADILSDIFNPPGVKAIENLFRGTSSPAESSEDIGNQGCLVVNSIFEIPDLPPPISMEINEYRVMLKLAFVEALENDGVGDVDVRAEFLLGALWGMLSQIRLAGDKTAAKPMAEVTIASMKSWK